MGVVAVILLCSAVGLVASVYYAKQVASVSVKVEDEALTKRLHFISSSIADGAMAFLKSEYKYVGIFSVVFAVIMVLILDDSHTDIHDGIYSGVAFLVGAFISSVCAFLGMKIAVMGNVRTAIKAKDGLSGAFKVAFHSGAVMGFSLVALALIGMTVMYLIYGMFIQNDNYVLMEMIAGFGLGGSSVALFLSLIHI